MKIETLDEIKDWFIDTPSPLAPAKYATIAILRRTEDYAIFRTESDRYTNSVATPMSRKNKEMIERALILASKQKAVERRHQNKIMRSVKPDAEECYLKDFLCLSCPVCILNGGIKAVKGADELSVKSRVLYQTAYSILPLQDIVESITFNAVDEKTTKTDQALGEREMVKPDTHFISAVSILAPTVDELKLYLYSMLNTTRYGAETRGLGVLENKLLALVLSDTEEFSALGLTLDVYGELVEPDTDIVLGYESILTSTDEVCFNPIKDKVDLLISGSQAAQLEAKIRGATPDLKWIDKMYKKAGEYRESVLKAGK
ncbi:MAG: putative Type I-D CRISPR-associated protein Cas7/Csc2 [Candidatus Thorarchaeota archaeon]|nr:MAG: putative Type I-D CRISPR-associated protein Cas7/Csc2 [Candidatus Thorarchaeota archaeon]